MRQDNYLFRKFLIISQNYEYEIRALTVGIRAYDLVKGCTTTARKKLMKSRLRSVSFTITHLF